MTGEGGFHSAVKAGLSLSSGSAGADDLARLETVIVRLREIDSIFDELYVGVCTIHLDACIAALETRLIDIRASGRPLRRHRTNDR